jgi:hypothetical protein
LKHALLCLSSLLYFLAPVAHARIGIIVGNGGHAVTCTDSGGRLISVEALDLYEGRLTRGYSYPTAQNINPLELAKALARKLDAAQENFYPPQGEPPTIESKVEHVARTMSFLPPGQTLDLTPDSDERLIFPAGCQLTQTINFRTAGLIQVNSDMWNQLSPTDKAALYLHEAVYWYLRETGVEVDSRRTRLTVSYLMSGGNVASRLTLPKGGWLKRVQYCRSTDPTLRGNWSTELIAYRDPQGHVVVQFLQMGAFRALTQSYIVGDIDGPVDELPLQKDSPVVHEIHGGAHSSLDPDAVIQVRWGNGNISVSGTLQPFNAFRDSVRCVEWPIP